jgi:hypothetical protein
MFSGGEKMKSIALSLLLLSTSAFASTTATLLLKGSIAPVLEVSVAPETLASNLPLDIAQTNTKIGTVTERSNSRTGYKVTITSQNAGKMKLDNDNSLSYQLTYDGQAVTLTQPQTFAFPFTSSAPVTRDVKINYQAAPSSLPTGDYTDTLTFTIAVN